MTVLRIEQSLHNFEDQKLANLFKGTRGGVQHGVWTRLQSFFIITESIVFTMLKPYITYRKSDETIIFQAHRVVMVQQK